MVHPMLVPAAMAVAWAGLLMPQVSRGGEAGDKPAAAQEPVRDRSPAVEDQDAEIHKQMERRWRTPERRTWLIDYRPIAGLPDRSSWHVKGTHWRVRIYPDVYQLDEFDKKAVYEIDAVALDQNYGVIGFYIYDRKKLE